MSVPNQRKVQIVQKELKDKDHLFAAYNQETLRQAMTKLKGSGLKMWLYLCKNKEGYQFELSRKACEDWGIKKDSYYDGFKDLVNNGYLRLSHPNSNIYYFFENALAENPPSGKGEFYFTDNTKPATEIQNRKYENQNRAAANPERNNINNTRIIKDNKTSAKPESDWEYWAELERQEEREAKEKTWASYSHLGF